MKFLTGIAISAFMFLFVAFWSFTIVRPGERGIRIRLGSVIGIVDQGLNFKAPFIEKIKRVHVRTQKEEVEASAASKDLQDVRTKVAVTSRIDTTYLAEIYSSIGYGDGEFTSKVILPATQESVKAATAQFTAEELVTKRAAVKEAIFKTLSERLRVNHAILDDVSIVDFAFSESFNAAIEAKVTAEQNALAAKNKLEQVKFEAQQKIETAKADAESIRIQGDALSKNPSLVQLKWVEKWDGKTPVYQMGNATPLISIPHQ